MRLLSAVAALFLVSSTSQSSALLARAATASGEPWRYHIRSVVFENEAEHLVEVRIDEQGPRVITRRCTGIVCGGSIVDADTRRRAYFSYNETPIAQSEPLDGRAVTLRAIVSYAFTSPQFAGTVVAKEPTHAGDRNVVPFAVTAPGGATLDALLDPATALLVGVAEDRHVLYLYDDEKRSGPVMLPMQVRKPDDTVERFAERTVVAEPLASPAGLSATFVPGAAATRLESGDIPRFACRIENVPLTCVLDTGAAGLALGLATADRLKKSPLAQIALEGTGRIMSGVVRAQSLDLGSLRIGPALYAIIPDTGAFKSDVVVGADVIGKAVVRIDAVHRTIRFDPAGSVPDGNVVPLRFDGFMPSIPIVLESTPTELALDTGDASSIDLASAFVSEHPGLFVPHRQERRGVAGVGGLGFQTPGTIPHVEFAGLSLRDVYAGSTYIPGSRAPSRVGAAFFSHFVLDLDYAESRMSVHEVR